MSMTPEEKFQFDVLTKLGSIEDRGKRNEDQLTAVNGTISDLLQRTSRLESVWSTMKVVAGFGVVLVVGAFGAVVAFFKGD